MKPDNLHELVWLALQYYSVRDRTQPNYNFQVFHDLQYNTINLENAAPETLCQLDMEAFLYATVRCSAERLEDKHRHLAANADQATMMPACLSEQLCTKEQQEWWNVAYKLYKNLAK